MRAFREFVLCPHRLVRPRTPAFQAGNTGSNPVGDATIEQPLNHVSAALFNVELGTEENHEAA